MMFDADSKKSQGRQTVAAESWAGGQSVGNCDGIVITITGADTIKREEP